MGHCMYGCQSCSIASHNVPLFFTRYCLGTLGFTSTDVRQRTGLTQNSPVVNDEVVEALCECMRALTANSAAQFFVKPHPALLHSNRRFAPFHHLQSEQANVHFGSTPGPQVPPDWQIVLLWSTTTK
eukprot:NODE_1526_length_1138_cov_14.489440_g1242_i0.p1 GENE.NODE_1526_length_1138_cov_14.489440_g1242_i0~~NODE_1526_length_1138_cov_14.489440_g1242_i0.p1  ORF type:complete len:127 (-),score=16.07 NODE_1526_length_1138_cov_14.489440_g1242_i0:604-984(-)